MSDLVATLRDDVLDIVVQTDAWKRLFSHCIAIPGSAGCGNCGGAATTQLRLSDGDRNRVKACLLSADAGRISGLKASLNAGTLVLFTRDGSGKLVRHQR